MAEATTRSPAKRARIATEIGTAVKKAKRLPPQEPLAACCLWGCQCDTCEEPGDSLLSSEEVEELRGFDLTMKYGPCVGISRAARWVCANYHGLEPPESVREILDSLDDDDPNHQPLFAKHSL